MPKNILVKIADMVGIALVDLPRHFMAQHVLNVLLLNFAVKGQLDGVNQVATKVGQIDFKAVFQNRFFDVIE